MRWPAGVQWKAGGSADALDSGDRAQPILQFAKKSETALGLLKALRIADGQEREEAVRIIAGLNVEQFEKAAEHQARAYKQYKGQRHLGDDDARSKQASRSQVRSPSGAA
jgi:hypothetical protein